MKRLFDKYREDLSGLFWLSFGIFVGVALISYSPLDPSLNSFVQNTKPHKLCCYFGSFLSD
jgi:S-DNA-T family DNA segregation ATPase FtsK/SpoIIIE